MTTVPATSMSLSADNLSAYTTWANSLPMLSVAEEKQLASSYRQDGNIESARRLVMAYFRVVIKVAKKYSGYGLAEVDLIQEGNVGLMKAVKRFDPNQGVRLVSFAIHWIKAEIHEYILRNWRIVKIATTKAQRKLFFNLRSMKKQLAWLKPNEIKEVANDLNVKPETVTEMESRLYSQDASYDAPLGDDGENAYAPADYLVAANADPEMLVMNADSAEDKSERLQQAFAELDERSQMILQRRWLNENKTTLQELAAELNVSAERIRQLEKQAMNQLRDLM